MTTMIAEVYDAFLSAGADEAKARAAAQAIADYGADIAAVKADLQLLKWMVGIVLAGIVSLIIKAFF